MFMQLDTASRPEKGASWDHKEEVIEDKLNGIELEIYR